MSDDEVEWLDIMDGTGRRVGRVPRWPVEDGPFAGIGPPPAGRLEWVDVARERQGRSLPDPPSPAPTRCAALVVVLTVYLVTVAVFVWLLINHLMNGGN